MIKKLPISAVVVSYDEGHMLDACLDSIHFCSEIILVDLESKDNTSTFAQKHGCRYILHERVPVVEYIRAWIHCETKFDWILFVDPDEVYTKELQSDIINLFSSGIDKSVGMIWLPWQFYFGEYKLKGTFWGGKKYKRILKHRGRNTFSSNIHKDMKLKPGYTYLRIPYKKSNVIKHKWVEDWDDMINKHERYLKEDGKSMFNNGRRYSWWKQAFYTIASYGYSLIWKRGFLDGRLGFDLSLFFAQYTYRQWSSLRTYQMSQDM